MTDHLCPIEATSGAVDPAWCFDRYADVLREMPPIRAEEDVKVPELRLMTDDDKWSMYYCPFDRVNPAAKVAIVGITPGLRQMYLANQEAQLALSQEASADEALRRACNIGSFGGRMRSHLVRMLDGIGVQTHLGIETTEALFEEHDALLHSTSMLMYPVFYKDEDYRGSQKASRNPTLRAFIERVLISELSLVPDALVIPLGTTVNKTLLSACDRGHLDRSRCLIDFPHPSEGNGHREKFYRERKDSLIAQVQAWSQR